MPSLPSLDPVRASAGASARSIVAFSGMLFELSGPASLLAHFGEVPLARVLADVPGHERRERAPLGSVRLCLREASRAQIAARESTLGSRDIKWEWRHHVGSATTRRAHVWWRSGPSGLDAEASLSPGRWGAESLLTALCAAVVHRAGGAVLHAASVETTQGVVAFIGPSGAGKSTACKHVLGANLYSVDRLAVAPLPNATPSVRWLAWPLPGGTGVAPMARPGRAGAPLAAVLRVHKGTASYIGECSRVLCVSSLRASAFHANDDPAVELELLARLERLAVEVPCANLHTLLGTSLEPLIRRWLTEKSKRLPTTSVPNEVRNDHVGA